MAIDHPKAGPNSIPAYQLSGVPYVTGSAANEVVGTGTPIKLEFPFVTRFFQIKNTDATHGLRVGFTEHGVKGTYTKNYFVLTASQRSEVLELRTKELYFYADGGASNPVSYEVVAGLTTIDRDQFPTLTGSIDYVTAFEGVG